MKRASIVVTAIVILACPISASSSANGNGSAFLAAQAADGNLVTAVLKGAPAFSQMTLVPGVKRLAYKPAWAFDGAFSGDGGPLYVLYELPLPAGTTAGWRMRGIGILDMGHITPLAPPSDKDWTPIGRLGDSLIVTHVDSNTRYKTDGAQLRRFSSSAFDPIGKLGTCGELSDGSTCVPGIEGTGIVAYAESASGNRRVLLTEAALDSALHGHAQQLLVWFFRFAGEDFADFKGAIFRLHAGSLTLVGSGTVRASGRTHILLQDPFSGTLSLNEEEAR